MSSAEHPAVGDMYGALTGACLEWRVEGKGNDGLWMLRVYEPSWREHSLRESFRKPNRRGRRPRRLFLTTKQLTNEKRWELIE